jgi:hypothetical protein
MLKSLVLKTFLACSCRSGSFGDVHKVRRREDGAIFAVKVMPPPQVLGPARERMHAQALGMGSGLFMSHPRIQLCKVGDLTSRILSL